MFTDRELTAVHEAGHAVAAAVLGVPIRYISLRPRNAHADGHMVGRWRDERRRQWLPELVVAAAGMVAEDALKGGEDRRSTVTAGADDLHELRGLARYTWCRAHDDDGYDHQLDPPIDPAWTVLDIVTHAWRQAHLLLAAHNEALWSVADELESTTRAMPGARVRHLVAQAEQDKSPLAADDVAAALAALEFWPARHSRLAWTAPGRTAARSTTREPAAAPTTSSGGRAGPVPAGEVTGLATALRYAEGMHTALAAHTATIEAFLQGLRRAAVAGTAITTVARAQEATLAAMGAWSGVAAALHRQTLVGAAYAATPEAGTRTWVTAG